ncbi:MAG: selenocysteine-specific translation elongation factor [candidate division Zixibacteria bacterium]|nr:selenocysteine-specific translation elongation factor [candidate division Zixibacteria bacterium]
MLVVGTAGHIDHGKSAIVKRLTGTDPDRLPEEKARGMTIDLGFAFYQTADNQTIALVDVPGHERFIRNMISGASGIDAVLLVIAADDGWMPQSEEHFQIIRLLGVSSGIIVINKSDLAETDWLEILKSDIKEKVKDSFLKDSPIIEVSAETGNGFDKLKKELDRLPQTISRERDIDKARLYIDRAFMSKGFGTVVTGTLKGGCFATGQTLSIWPSLKKAKIRSLQSNSKDVEKASPGQRTAISLTGTDKDELQRGRVLIAEKNLSHFKENPVLVLRLEVLKNSPLSLSSRRRLTFITGTTECQGEIRIFKDKQINPGSSGTVFFKPDDPVYALLGDHFIIRLPTPMLSLGGGIVIDHVRKFPRQKELEQFSYLDLRTDWQLDKIILSELSKENMLKPKELLVQSSFGAGKIKSELEKLLNAKKCGQIGDYIFETGTFEKISKETIIKIEKFLKENSHVTGLTIEQIEQLLRIGEEKTRVILNYLVTQNMLSEEREKYNLVNRQAGPEGKIRAAFDDIMNMLSEKPFAPPRLADIASKGSSYRQAIRYILDNNSAHKCGSEFLFANDAWRQILEFIRECLNNKSELKVTDLRDKFSFSRKYSIPILEETDRLKITRRQGDIRVKGENFEK